MENFIIKLNGIVNNTKALKLNEFGVSVFFSKDSLGIQFNTSRVECDKEVTYRDSIIPPNTPFIAGLGFYIKPTSSGDTYFKVNKDVSRIHMVENDQIIDLNMSNYLLNLISFKGAGNIDVDSFKSDVLQELLLTDADGYITASKECLSPTLTKFDVECSKYNPTTLKFSDFSKCTKLNYFSTFNFIKDDISNFPNISSLSTVKFKRGIYGKMSSLKLYNVTDLELPSGNDVKGTVEEFLSNCVSNGRNSGQMKIWTGGVSYNSTHTPRLIVVTFSENNYTVSQ